MPNLGQTTPENLSNLPDKPLFDDLGMTLWESAERTLSSILDNQIPVPNHVLAMLVNEYMYHRKKLYTTYPLDNFLSPELIEKLKCDKPILFNSKRDLVGIPPDLTAHIREKSNGKEDLEYPTKGFSKVLEENNQARLQRLVDEICEPEDIYLYRVFNTQEFDEVFLHNLELLVNHIYKRTKENPHSYLHTLNVDEVKRIIVMKYRNHFVELTNYHAMEFNKEKLFRCLFLVIEHVYTLNDHELFWEIDKAPEEHKRRPFVCVETTLKVLLGYLQAELSQAIQITKNTEISQGRIFEMIPIAFSKIEWIEWMEKGKSCGLYPYWYRRAIWGIEKGIQEVEETDAYRIKRLGTISEIEGKLNEEYREALRFPLSRPTQHNRGIDTTTDYGTMAKEGNSDGGKGAEESLRSTGVEASTRTRLIKYPPIPPGDMIRSKILDSQGIGPVEAAVRLGVSRTYFSNILNGQRSLSLEMALKIEDEFGILTAEELIGYQTACQITESRALNPTPC